MQTADSSRECVFAARNVSCGYGERAVLENVSFELYAGDVLALLGPNGVGKTTLFKSLLGFLPLVAGEIEVCARPSSSFSRKEFSQVVAYIPQAHMPSLSFSVRDMVLMGRTPYLSAMASPSRLDEEVVDEVLADLRLEALAQRDFNSLSGGEQQLVLVARALAQRPRVLIMDEPCANLDFGNQALLLERLLVLSERGMAVCMTTHDPNHAFLLDGDVLCFGRDGFALQGAAFDVLTPQNMSTLYGVEVRVAETEGEAGLSARSVMRACFPFVRKARR